MTTSRAHQETVAGDTKPSFPFKGKLCPHQRNEESKPESALKQTKSHAALCIAK